MSKKKPQPQPAPARPQAAKAAPAVKNMPVAAASGGFAGKYTEYIIVGIIALLTFLFYKACLGNALTNWDDLGYITNDMLIKDSSAEGLKNIFKVSNPVMGNYHPLTILLYAIEYSHYGLEPYIYHLDSVLAHVLCTLVVYGFAKALTRNMTAAAIVALLFGLHPMHVENVAWAAGRKDILYGMFYMQACTTYLWYLRNQGGKKGLWYALTIVLFAISLLCKSVGVTLPLVLWLLDYYERRRPSLREIDMWTIIDKIPFFALSLLFGIISITTQKDIGALGTIDVHFSPVERIALACYGLFTYTWKALVPAGMTNFYPYPIKVGDALPGMYYIYPVIIAAIAFAIWRFGRKNKMVVFGVLFFVVNLLLLLQLLPVGGAIIADRYCYIPYIGLFLIAASFVSRYMEQEATAGSGKALLGGMVAYGLVLGFVTADRCKDWYDSVSLWKDNIAKQPESPVGYFYLGQEYYSRFEDAKTPQERQAYADSAGMQFNLSIARKPDYINPIICLGELQRSTGQIDEAKHTYLRARQINDKDLSVYQGLGVVYAIKQQYDSSILSFRKAISLKAYCPEVHSNYANLFDILHQPDSALAEYAIAIAQNPDAYIPFMNRGQIYLRMNKYDEAIKDYTRATEIKPDNGAPYYQRAQAYAGKGMKAQALQDVQKATQLGFTQMDAAFVQRLKS